MSRTNLYECVQHSSGTAKVGVWVIVTVRVRHCTVVKYPHSTWPYIFLGLPMFLKSPVLLYCARCQIRRTFIYFFKIELGLCGGPLPLCTAGLWARVAPCRGGAGNLKIFLRLVLRGNYHQDVLCVNVKHTATCKDTSQLVHACVCWRGHCGRPAGHIMTWASFFTYICVALLATVLLSAQKTHQIRFEFVLEFYLLIKICVGDDMVALADWTNNKQLFISKVLVQFVGSIIPS